MTTIHLQRELPGTKVHVVASQGKADETILYAAQDEFVLVRASPSYTTTA
jgi:hypothetical protein